jgi:proline dehydrogenase
MNYFINDDNVPNKFPQSSQKEHSLLEKLLFRLSKKWIAGYNIDDALSYALNANEKGLCCIINYLGEELKNQDRIKKTVIEYKNLIKKMKESGIEGSISIKPTQIGLSLDMNFCLDNLLEITFIAKKNNIFIWIDMESFKNIEATLTIYQKVREENNEMGIVLQSYLKRSYSDLVKLLAYKPNIRIVKGAYQEKEKYAFRKKVEVDNNYVEMMNLLFLQRDNLRENQIFAIATHDANLIQKSLDLFYLHDFKKEHLQFQFLKGIREKLKVNLLKKGFNVCEYVPYGDNWLPYSLRRLRERKSNIILLLRSLLST